MINWMLSKCKTFAVLKICLRKQKDKSKIEENISKHRPHIVLYTEYIKNSFNSIIKIQVSKIFEQKLYQRRYRMTNKHMKRCLFNIIIKITRCPCTPITMTKSTHLTTPSVSEGAEHLELPCVAGGNARRSRASQFCFFNKVKCIFTR